jgi:CubicO group peptidase (beta-lactamase class C family)
MLDTSVKMTAEQRARSVPVHMRNEDGSFAITVMDFPQEPEFWAGGHALYSTAADYLRFERMLLGGGVLDGTRILQPKTVDEAFRNQIGDLDFPKLKTSDPILTLDVDLGPNLKWGLGLLLNTTQQPGMRAAGSGAWAGLFNSHFWIDRQTGVAACLLMQLLPFFDPRAVELYVGFEQALYANL